MTQQVSKYGKHTSDSIATSEWRGYDLDELRFQRAYMLARCEVTKMKLESRIDRLRRGVPAVQGSGMVSRMLGGLNYVDYAFVAYKIASKVFKIFRRRRR